MEANWSSQVLGIVKIGAWKAWASILPTHGRLSERGIDIDTQCPLCDHEVETQLRALHDCMVAFEALNIMPLALFQSTNQQANVQSWLCE